MVLEPGSQWFCLSNDRLVHTTGISMVMLADNSGRY